MKNTMKKPVAIPVEKLRPFAGHPFKVKDDAEMNTLIESIQTQGILSPLIVRPIENTDEYEVISGHRRLHAAQKAGISEVPALIYALDRDAAVIAVVDSNLHREHILSSEKAFAYKMKYEAIADDQCISILTRYIPLFQNVGIRLDLIKQQFCRKNHTECSDFLEKWYYDLKRENALNKAIENTLDNAFAKIQDKRKIAFYLQLIEKADQFPLVMTMLGKWNIENAKPIIINRLEIDRIKPTRSGL